MLLISNDFCIESGLVLYTLECTGQIPGHRLRHTEPALRSEYRLRYDMNICDQRSWFMSYSALHSRFTHLQSWVTSKLSSTKNVVSNEIQ